MSHENDFHVATPEDFQLHAQPLHMLVSRLRLGLASIHRAVRIEEVHRIETDHSQPTGDNLGSEPATLNKGMTLIFRNEGVPNFRETLRPFIRAPIEDVMRHDIVIAERRDHRDR